MPLARRLRPLHWALVAIALAWAAVPVVLLVYHVLRHGGVLTGSDGPLAGADQLFYMDSIRQSGEHLLIGDNYAIGLGHDVFLDPLFLVGGLLWRLGLPLQAAFWALKLIAAPAIALGAVALASLTLDGTRERAAAAAIGLFYFSPVALVLLWGGSLSPITHYGLLLPAGESSPVWQLWGYPQSGVALGAMAAAVVMLVRISERHGPAGSTRKPTRTLVAASAAAGLAAWLHPWQGATLIVVAVALVLHSRSKRAALTLAVPVVAAALPLLYEEILSRADAAWRVDSTQNAVGHDPVWMVLVVVLPLALPALAGIRVVRSGAVRTALISWPLAALAAYFTTSQFAYHALQGITLPLAVLAVAGWRRIADFGSLARPIIAVALVLAATVPGAVYELKVFRDSERSGAAPYWLTPGEHDALVYLDHAHGSGAVLARDYLGSTVPPFTGRHTWVGEFTWTPQYVLRSTLAERLMAGRMSPLQARGFVSATGVAFVLSDCRKPAQLAAALGPMVSSRHQFGCASVYVLR
jgi:hypothetical protein